jgi:hypothetical protein
LSFVARAQKYCKENLSGGKFEMGEVSNKILGYLQKPYIIVIIVLVFILATLST